eukprot:1139502-Pelagomonas_calceolata.AAC.9
MLIGLAMLQTNNCLQELILSWNKLRPKGVIAIAESLKPNMALQVRFYLPRVCRGACECSVLAGKECCWRLACLSDAHQLLYNVHSAQHVDCALSCCRCRAGVGFGMVLGLAWCGVQDAGAVALGTTLKSNQPSLTVAGARQGSRRLFGEWASPLVGTKATKSQEINRQCPGKCFWMILRAVPQEWTWVRKLVQSHVGAHM